MELLAPGGDVDCIKAAIKAGAKAIYCGLDKFNARNRAKNITIQDLPGILRLAHQYDCEVFLTLNIIIIESEIPALIRLLNILVNTRIDGLIVQDLGLLYLLSTYYPSLNIHGSTQLTTHNKGQIKFLNKLQACRVNLSRELSLPEIKALTTTAHANNILTEVFVHGSNCISFSGLCYLSSVLSGNSGNRGRCSQPCRDQYKTTDTGQNFPLNIKDNSAYFNLAELAQAGVDSIKIEGRIKKSHYVYTVVDCFRKQLQRFYHGKPALDNNELYKVFNRDFTNGFLHDNINKNMFIDNPRDHSALHLATTKGGCTAENIDQAKRELYDIKTEIISQVREEIEPLSINKAPLTMTISGQQDTPLHIVVETPETSFSVVSNQTLTATTHQQGLNEAMLLPRFKAINDTEYFITKINLQDLQPDLFIPFKELTALKKKILFLLHDSRDMVAPLEVPPLNGQPSSGNKAGLSLLISSMSDVHLGEATSAEIYFQLPNTFKHRWPEFIDFFAENSSIIPWFPSVLIGEDYGTAVEFLNQVQPKRIVTNNSGIAYAAYKQETPWVAGPYLNMVNSFSLLCLQEKFNCSGAFISNEINQQQIKKIKKPANFKLHYSIYHPIVLLTSRACLFHQVTGCSKDRVDHTCLQQCTKSATISHLKKGDILLRKRKGHYHQLYNEHHYLNTDIVTDLPGFFSSFLVDLREITTRTKISLDKEELVTLFADHLAGIPQSAEKLKQNIQPTTNPQYKKGI